MLFNRTIEFPVVAFTSSIFFWSWLSLYCILGKISLAVCIIEFLTGFGCVLVNLLQCDSRKRASLSCFFCAPCAEVQASISRVFSRAQRSAAHIFLVALEQYANGAFMSVKIVARNVKLYSCLLWLRCLLVVL